jgi:hypothetical protein
LVGELPKNDTVVLFPSNAAADAPQVYNLARNYRGLLHPRFSYNLGRFQKVFDVTYGDYLLNTSSTVSIEKDSGGLSRF